MDGVGARAVLGSPQKLIYQKVVVCGLRSPIQEGISDSYLKDGAMLEELTESVKDTIKSAARKLTGFRRRHFFR